MECFVAGWGVYSERLPSLPLQTSLSLSDFVFREDIDNEEVPITTLALRYSAPDQVGVVHKTIPAFVSPALASMELSRFSLEHVHSPITLEHFALIYTPVILLDFVIAHAQALCDPSLLSRTPFWQYLTKLAFATKSADVVGPQYLRDAIER
ncbi:hypothetical protein POSPLADRAFT_1056504 [Postia placenta MAD-698-R-SB12]|uniref:Uncharacterized protein n=1 Tax=Postia placenta MAD-698-R-SB12 TaxID=670580 RepID=A0A1X6N3D5_9APHY|nr:hypothetical protein POSPLADRAFT_1056504 [Postia placenta MAD-698-R-SB12]OSX63141.1 hypothetical protein POSPLADRAFT_1056504 [Postia placenta MAD-698-R-SB12]